MSPQGHEAAYELRGSKVCNRGCNPMKLWPSVCRLSRLPASQVETGPLLAKNKAWRQTQASTIFNLSPISCGWYRSQSCQTGRKRTHNPRLTQKHPTNKDVVTEPCVKLVPVLKSSTQGTQVSQGVFSIEASGSTGMALEPSSRYFRTQPVPTQTRKYRHSIVCGLYLDTKYERIIS